MTHAFEDKFANLSDLEIETLLRSRMCMLDRSGAANAVNWADKLSILTDILRMAESLKMRVVKKRIHPPTTADELKWANEFAPDPVEAAFAKNVMPQ